MLTEKILAVLILVAAASAAAETAPVAASGVSCSATVPCTLQLTPAEVGIIEQALASAPIPANTSVPLIQKIDGQRLLQQRQAEKTPPK